MKENKKEKGLKAIMMAILITVCIIIVLPYVWMLSNSFKSTKETLTDAGHFIPRDFTLQGYQSVLFESPFFKWLLNSTLIAVIVVFVVLFSSTLVGYIFARYNFKMKKFLFMVLLATMMVPAQTTMIPAFLLINKMGLYDTLWAVIIPTCISAFGIYLCKQFCEEIPKELLESARIDGASDFIIYLKIVLPQIRPAIGALAIFSFLECWNDYLRPLLYLSSTDKMTLPLALSYFSTSHSSNLSATMAAAALIMVPTAIVFMIFQKQFVKGIAMTGMK